MQDTKLEARINFWKFGIAGFALILIAAYFWYFGFHLEQPAAENADKWGQFGDFFGGLLNPLVAFAAFYWLTQSVMLQKKELTEARTELRKMEESNAAAVEIAAITTLLPYYEKRRNGTAGRLDEIHKLFSGVVPSMGIQLTQKIEELNADLAHTDQKMKDAEARLEHLLNKFERL